MVLSFTTIEPAFKVKKRGEFIPISYQEFYNKVKKNGGNNNAVTNSKRNVKKQCQPIRG